MAATPASRPALRSLTSMFSRQQGTAIRTSISGNARLSTAATRTLSQNGRSNAVATSSRVTIAQFTMASRSTQRTFSSLAMSTMHSRRTFPLQSPRHVRLQRRSVVTMTRRPEQPEDPEVLAGDQEPSLIVTDRAIDHLRKVADKENNNNLALRVAVEPGGCHGYQYKMELTDEIEEDDFRFSVGDKVHLLVDSTSLRLIKGSTIDYVTELIGSQFAIFHNPQAKGAGCGCGVSWEPIV